MRHHLSKQITLFLLVGSASTLLSYSIFLIALRLFGLHYLIANACGFILSISFNYYCNKRWTFDSKGSNHFWRYFCFYVFSLTLSSILLKIIVEYGAVIPEIANILTIVIMTVVNFIVVKFFIFKK